MLFVQMVINKPNNLNVKLPFTEVTIKIIGDANTIFMPFLNIVRETELDISFAFVGRKYMKVSIAKLTSCSACTD